MSENKIYLSNLINILENKKIDVGDKLVKCCDYLFNNDIEKAAIDRFMDEDYIWPANISDEMIACIKAVMGAYMFQIIAMNEIMKLKEEGNDKN